MKDRSNESLRFPIGRFTEPDVYDAAFIESYINDIVRLPDLLASATKEMSDAQLDTPYRPEGWTARQVIHHLADSHINSYTRFKLALTEDNPDIRPYDEVSWAELPDGKSAPIDLSLDIITALHRRWTFVLKDLDTDQLQRTFYHPGSKMKWPLQYALAFYAWHGKHHLGHVRLVQKII